MYRGFYIEAVVWGSSPRLLDCGWTPFTQKERGELVTFNGYLFIYDRQIPMPAREVWYGAPTSRMDLSVDNCPVENVMPYLSYYQVHERNGKVTSVQTGNDYNHTDPYSEDTMDVGMCLNHVMRDMESVVDSLIRTYPYLVPLPN
jgi:hypothetical protein